MAHRCPPRCHNCPELPGREVMPNCYGTAVHGSADPTSFAWCNCERPGKGAPSLEQQVLELKERIAVLEAR